jgi:hypothetical protein
MMNDTELLLLMQKRVDQAGSIAAWAAAHGLSSSYAHDVLRNRALPGKRILDALGVRRIVKYESILGERTDA